MSTSPFDNSRFNAPLNPPVPQDVDVIFQKRKTSQQLFCKQNLIVYGIIGGLSVLVLLLIYLLIIERRKSTAKAIQNIEDNINGAQKINSMKFRSVKRKSEKEEAYPSALQTAKRLGLQTEDHDEEKIVEEDEEEEDDEEEEEKIEIVPEDQTE